MLYLTTRDRVGSYTPKYAMNRERCACGGFFYPNRLPVLTEVQLAELPAESFGQRVAQIMNIFFGEQLNGWEIEFSAGRHPARISAMNHKIAVLEAWHNSNAALEGFISNVFDRLEGEGVPGSWFRIAVRIALLFAAFGDLMKAGIAEGDHPVDIALDAGEFESVLAAWYARKMGLPIGTIVLGCNDSSSLWDFFHHGELDTKCDTQRRIPGCLELLILETLGFKEAQRFVSACRENKHYFLRDDQLRVLQKGMCCAVIRQHRRDAIVRNVYGTNCYLMEPGTAQAYGALQDYRSSRGETACALILSEKSPLAVVQEMVRILSVPADVIQKIMDA